MTIWQLLENPSPCSLCKIYSFFSSPFYCNPNVLKQPPSFKAWTQLFGLLLVSPFVLEPTFFQHQNSCYKHNNSCYCDLVWPHSLFIFLRKFLGTQKFQNTNHKLIHIVIFLKICEPSQTSLWPDPLVCADALLPSVRSCACVQGQPQTVAIDHRYAYRCLQLCAVWHSAALSRAKIRTNLTRSRTKNPRKLERQIGGCLIFFLGDVSWT